MGDPPIKRSPGLRALDERIAQLKEEEYRKLAIEDKLRMNEQDERNPFRSGGERLWTPANVFFLIVGVLTFVRILDYVTFKVMVKEFGPSAREIMQGLRGVLF